MSHDIDTSQIFIHAYVFKNIGVEGDFDFMIKNDIKNGISDTLYIFNDNEESFYNMSFSQGKGNAIIRKYNIYAMKKKHIDRPYSHGIPTGSLAKKGYTELDKNVKYIVDICIKNIKIIIKKFNIKRIYYSASGPSKGDTLIGQSLFKINNDVRKYITEQIHSLTSNDIIYEP